MSSLWFTCLQPRLTPDSQGEIVDVHDLAAFQAEICRHLLARTQGSRARALGLGLYACSLPVGSLAGTCELPGCLDTVAGTDKEMLK